MRSVNGIFTTVRPTSPIPSTYAGLPEDMDDWSCAEWVTYHKRVKAALGKDKAIDIVSRDSDSIGIWANSNSCKYNCEWSRYFKSEGIDPGSNIFSSLYCTAENVSNTAEGITSPGFLKPLIVIAVIGGGAYIANKAGLFDSFKKKRRK
jgi:hypothetical protein